MISTQKDRLTALPFQDVAGHTFPELYAMRVEDSPDRVAVNVQEADGWTTRTWAELQRAAEAFASALREMGVEAGEHVVLMTAPRVEGLIAMWAIQAVGAVPCGVYANTDGETLAYLLDLTGAKLLVVEQEEFLERALSAGSQTSLEVAVVFDELSSPQTAGPRRYGWRDLLADAAERAGDAPMRAVPDGSPDDPCAVYFTSGTTARPKAVVLSHRNILSSYFAPFGDGPGQLPRPDASDRMLHDIQLGSVAGAVFGLFYPLVYGCSTYIAAKSTEPLSTLREVRPTLFLAFPRTWEQLATDVIDKIDNGAAVSEALAAVGLGDVKYALAGGLPADAVKQWRDWGVIVRGIFGMNETGGLATMQTAEAPNPGTSGAALPGMELVLDVDGEILVRGAGVFAGYLGNPEATADALDPAGWLHTGDIGELDGSAELRVIDRKSDIVVLADGTSVATSAIAGALKHSRYIRDALVVGANRPFCGVLIEPDLAALRAWADHEGVAGDGDATLLASERTLGLFDADVSAANARLAAEGQPAIGGFRVLPRELDPADPTEVTATRKLRRQHLAVKFSDLIDDLYETEAERG